MSVRERSKALVVIVLLAANSTAVQEVAACSCTPQRDDAESIRAQRAASDAVFSGYVVSLGCHYWMESNPDIKGRKRRSSGPKTLGRLGQLVR